MRVAGCLALGCIKVTPVNLLTVSLTSWLPQPWALSFFHLLHYGYLNAFSFGRPLRALSPWCTCAKRTQKS